ncbi:hypothetical protein CcaCcLH18_07920 [Colletotrichum camelliae]|nr:hypothetical protein CcaCcLH18_07920 [Colletotrichum camelliae]
METANTLHARATSKVSRGSDAVEPDSHQSQDSHVLASPGASPQSYGPRSVTHVGGPDTWRLSTAHVRELSLPFIIIDVPGNDVNIRAF